METARVVHVNKDPYDVYVGRGKGPWGNPFRIGDPHPETGRPTTREGAISLHLEWLARGEGRPLLRRLGELEGKTLGCFCAPKGGVTEADEPFVCHGQNLLKLLAWRHKKLDEKRHGNPAATFFEVVRESQRSFRTGDVARTTVASGLTEDEARYLAAELDEEAEATGALARHAARPDTRTR